MKLLKTNFQTRSGFNAVTINAINEEHSSFCSKHRYFRILGSFLEHEDAGLSVTALPDSFFGFRLGSVLCGVSQEYVPQYSFSGKCESFLILDYWDLFKEVPYRCECPEWITSPPEIASDDPGEALAEVLRNDVFQDALGGDTPFPCPGHGTVRGLWNMVIHLNDYHKWGREEIADWVERVAEEQDIDISFPTPTTIPKEPGER